MENASAEYTSIFDIMEESSESSELFKWSRDQALFAYHTEEFLHEGELLTENALDGALKSNRFVLTHSVLIKYKVRI